MLLQSLVTFMVKLSKKLSRKCRAISQICVLHVGQSEKVLNLSGYVTKILLKFGGGPACLASNLSVDRVTTNQIEAMFDSNTQALV